MNIMEWNISGLKSEVDKWLYLNHIETEWPHVQLVLLTEPSHTCARMTFCILL